MSTEWRLLISPASSGAWNMAVDEAILEGVVRGDVRPTLRLYSWNPACLSLGHAQSYEDVDTARLKARGWDLVRRPTGGRAILHIDEFTYSVIAPTTEPLMAGSVLQSYNRLSRALVQGVRALGLAAELTAQPHAGADIPNPICFEVPSAFEITVGGKKLLGSAQARRRKGVLQHGSLPLTGDLARITDALVFPDDGARRDAAGRLLSRATTVEKALGHAVSWEETAEAFEHAFEAQFGITFQDRQIADAEQERAAALVKEKYDHPSWTRRV